jgi:hypothetical protein
MANGGGPLMAAQKLDAVGGQRRVGLVDDGVAGRNEGVGLVVVLELARTYVDRPMMGPQDERRVTLRIYARRGERARGQQRGQKPQRFTSRLQETTPSCPGV